jgi:hypothetical protein
MKQSPSKRRMGGSIPIAHELPYPLRLNEIKGIERN